MVHVPCKQLPPSFFLRIFPTSHTRAAVVIPSPSVSPPDRAAPCGVRGCARASRDLVNAYPHFRFALSGCWHGSHVLSALTRALRSARRPLPAQTTMASLNDFAPLVELCEHQGGAVQQDAVERAFTGSGIQEHARLKVSRESGTPIAALILCGWDVNNQDLVHAALAQVVRERTGPEVTEDIVKRLVTFIRASAMSIGFNQVLDAVDNDKERAVLLWDLFDERAHRDGVQFISLALRLPSGQLAADAVALLQKWA